MIPRRTLAALAVGAVLAGETATAASAGVPEGMTKAAYRALHIRSEALNDLYGNAVCKTRSGRSAAAWVVGGRRLGGGGDACRGIKTARAVAVPNRAVADGCVKTSAAWLIERAGFTRGYGSGRVGISCKHTLALVNRGGGTAAELVALAREIAGGVRDAFGVALRPEPVFVGHAW